MNSMSSMPTAPIKSEQMEKFLADIPTSHPMFRRPDFSSQNLSESQYENLPKNFSNPLQILTDSVNVPKMENPSKLGDNPLKMMENPLFSAALQQLARDTEEKSRNLSPSLIQQAQAIQFLAQLQNLLLLNPQQQQQQQNNNPKDHLKHSKKVKIIPALKGTVEVFSSDQILI